MFFCETGRLKWYFKEVPSGVVLATVNIYNAKIVSQENNVLNISFDLSNREMVQTGVKYGIKLIKETTKGQFVVDEKIYDESLTLVENTTIKKQISYTAPANLSGDYTVLLVSKSETGFPFAVAVAGKIKLVSTVKGIEIFPDTCYLTIKGEKGSPKYNLAQGMDIKSTENLMLNCSAINTGKETLIASSQFETHYRTTYSKIVPQTENENSPITFKAGEKKTISLILPKATEPQAYDVVATLKSGELSSNSIITHYVLQGVSATIQNLSLDKDYYQKGETATLSFSWSRSADNFPGSRANAIADSFPVFLSGTITNGNGQDCAEPILKDLSKDQTVKSEIPISIITSCVDPILSLSLKDESGKILDEKTFSVKTTTKEEPKTPLYIIIIILAVVILLAGYFWGKRKNPNNSRIATILLIMGIIIIGNLAIAQNADADTYVQGDTINTLNISANSVNPTCS